MKKIAILISILLGTIILEGCDDIMTSSEKDIFAVQEKHEAQLLDIPGVEGIGIGECDGEPCFKVYVTQITPDLESQIPEELEGFKVEVEAGGIFEIETE